MEDKRYTEQDELMRSLLQEGRESVPAGLWENINSRLDAGEHLVAPTVHRPMWKRVVLTLSGIAAVVAAGSLLWLNTPDTPSAPEVLADIALAPSPSDDSPVLAESRANAIVPVATPPLAATLAATTSAAAPVEEPIASSSESTETTEIQATTEEVKCTETRTAPAEEAPKADIIGTEKEVEISLEEAFPMEEETKGISPRERFSLTVGGLTGGNFPDGKKTFGPHHGISQPKPVKTGIIDKGSSQHDLPLTVGLGLKFNFHPRWAVATGVNYTRLGRKFNGTFSDSEAGTLTDTRIKNTQHYVGIPLHFYYSILKTKHVDFYTMFGGSVELNVGNQYTLLDMENRIWKEKVDGVQWSVNVGLGVEFLLTRWLGLYIDPSLSYWFDNAQPTSIRTQQPLSLSAALGLRFRF